MVSITHKYVSANGDPPDSSLIGQTKWNDHHDLILSQTGIIIGRKSSGSGDAEELSAADVVAILAGEIVKPTDLAPVATSGSYSDLTDKPTLGTAAAHSASDFATAAQGAKADSAVQPGDLGTAASHAASDFATAAQGTKADSALQSFDVAAAVHAATSKSTPVDADELGLVDSAASNVLKKLTWANLKAGAKTYFDTVYQAKFTFTPREVLTANRSYYVRTDGSDSNTGLANTSGGAFLTQQKAIDTVASLDLSIYDVTILCGPGTRTEPLTLKKTLGAGVASLEGDVTTPSNCTQSVTGNDCFSMATGAVWQLRGFKTQTTTSGIHISASAAGCELKIDGNMEFGATPAYHVNVSTGGLCRITSGYTVSANASSHINIQSGGIVFYTPGAVTISGTPAWASAFMSVTSGGLVTTAGATFTGAATGKRYDASLNGIINTFGGGASYFPGDAAGTAATGGQYA